MNPSLILAFWGTALILIIVPGPDWAFILGARLRDRIVFPAVGGLMIGYALLTVVVAAGVAALISGAPLLLTLLTFVGAAYLIYLGVGLLRDPSWLSRPSEVNVAPLPWWTQVTRGIGVSGLNPKGVLIFLAILPQFADPSGSWPFPVQIAALGGGFRDHMRAFLLNAGSRIPGSTSYSAAVRIARLPNRRRGDDCYRVPTRGRAHSCPAVSRRYRASMHPARRSRPSPRSLPTRHREP